MILRLLVKEVQHQDEKGDKIFVEMSVNKVVKLELSSSTVTFISCRVTLNKILLYN